jgi:hypothetical protein
MALTFMPLLCAYEPDEGTTRRSSITLRWQSSSVVAPLLSFSLLPSVSPTQRTRRLLAFALADLRRSAVAAFPATPFEWEDRMYGRLAALPDSTAPLAREKLLAVLDVGSALVQLREAEPRLTLRPELDDSLAALAEGRSAMARARLGDLELRLASLPDGTPGADLALRARANILAMSEALDRHSTFFDAGARHEVRRGRSLQVYVAPFRC